MFFFLVIVIVLYYRFCCKVKFVTRMGTCQEFARTEAAGGRVLREGCSSSSESILLHNKFRFWCWGSELMLAWKAEQVSDMRSSGCEYRTRLALRHAAIMPVFHCR